MTYKPLKSLLDKFVDMFEINYELRDFMIEWIIDLYIEDWTKQFNDL